MTHDDRTREDEAMRRLLHDAVDHVEPRDVLRDIHDRTRSGAAARPWVWGVGGAVVAAAATITAVALMGGNGGTAVAPERDFAGSPTVAAPTVTGSTEPAPTEEPSTDPTPPNATTAVPVYYVGDTPYGPRLYREFQEAPIVGDTDAKLDEALDRAVGGTPLDPDYRSAWPLATSVSATFDGELITVDLQGSASDLRTRPGAMTEPEAQLAVEQLIYTGQGVVQERAPVQLLINGQHTDQVLGVPASEPLAAGDPIQTLALVQVTTPEQGQTVSGSFVAEGVASSFEATVPWEIRQGDSVVMNGFSTAEGYMGRLYPWETERIDVSDLEPGEYTFVALTSDPSGGAEGNGPYQDSKLIVVE